MSISITEIAAVLSASSTIVKSVAEILSSSSATSLIAEVSALMDAAETAFGDAVDAGQTKLAAVLAALEVVWDQSWGSFADLKTWIVDLISQIKTAYNTAVASLTAATATA